MYNYPGNIHIHSTYSDGSGTVAEIAQAAADAGLSYIIICDHQTLAALQEEAMSRGVLVLAGMEINIEKNHYLGLNLQSPVDSNDNQPQGVIDQVNKQGGFGIIAHPFDRGSRYIEKGKAFPWRDWPVFGFTGMEIWNFSSHWRGLHPSLFRTLYWFFLNRKGAMKGPPRRLLKLWDCYNMNGHRIAGIGSSDAHAYRYKLPFFSIIIFSYRYTFTTINTYVVLQEKLSGRFQEAKNQVLNAIKDGRCYTAFESYGAARDFSFRALNGKDPVLMGETVTLDDGLLLEIKAPSKCSQIRLICNGELIAEDHCAHLNFYPTKAGIYRTEVYYRPLLGKARPWIYSNPIYIC